MRIALFFQMLVILLGVVLYPVQLKAENSAYFTIGRAIEKAGRNNLELGKLKLSLRELQRSKINIYRALLPKLKANISGSKTVQEGEADTASYTVGVTLEQLLYDQLSTPLKLKGYYNSIEETRLKIDQKKKQIEEKVTDLYLSIIFGEKQLKNNREKIILYEKLMDLMNMEYKIGTKTLVDVVEAEKKLLEARLEREKLSQNINISYRDLINLLNFDNENLNDNLNVFLDKNMDRIYYRTFKSSGITSINTLVEHIKLVDIEAHRKALYSIAMDKDFNLHMLSVLLRNNAVKRRLNNLLWLKNVSINCGIDFSGDRFFPVNRTYSIGANILFDFGFLAPEVSISSSNQSGGSSISKTAESDIFNQLAPVKKGEVLKIEAHNLKRQIEDRRRKIKRDLDVWFIKMNALIKRYDIYRKQREIATKNEEIISLKKDIGEVKSVDYLQFMIEKKDFELKMDELIRDFIKSGWEFEAISNMSMSYFLGLK